MRLPCGTPPGLQVHHPKRIPFIPGTMLVRAWASAFCLEYWSMTAEIRKSRESPVLGSLPAGARHARPCLGRGGDTGRNAVVPDGIAVPVHETSAQADSPVTVDHLRHQNIASLFQRDRIGHTLVPGHPAVGRNPDDLLPVQMPQRTVVGTADPQPQVRHIFIAG